MKRSRPLAAVLFSLAASLLLAEGSPVPLLSAAPAPRAKAPAPGKSAPGTGTLYHVPVGTSPVLGPADALVTVVIFGNLECRFTQAALGTLTALQKANRSDMRLVWKHLPLAVHRRAGPAAEAAAEAHRVGRFWPFVGALRAARFALDDASLERAGVAAGLKPGMVSSAIKALQNQATVKSDQQLAARLLVSATPSMFFNGVRIQGGALPQSAFQGHLAQARKAVQMRLKISGVSRLKIYEHIVGSGIQPGPAPSTRRGVLARPHVDALMGAGRVGASGAKPARPASRPTLDLAHSPVHGPEDALVTAILFTSFRCGNSHEVWNAYQEAARQRPGMFRLYFVNHSVARGDKVAWQAAEAALTAHSQGKFWDMAEILFQNRYHLTPEKIEEYAIELGLNEKAFRAAMKGRTHRPRVEKDVWAAGRFLDGSSACPALWLNGRVQSGYLSTWRVRSFFDQAAKEVQGLRVRPLP